MIIATKSMHTREHTGTVHSPELWQLVAPPLSCYFPISCLSVCRSSHELGPRLQAVHTNKDKNIRKRFADILDTRLQTGCTKKNPKCFKYIHIKYCKQGRFKNNTHGLLCSRGNYSQHLTKYWENRRSTSILEGKDVETHSLGVKQ